jgi:hypothetical protein
VGIFFIAAGTTVKIIHLLELDVDRALFSVNIFDMLVQIALGLELLVAFRTFLGRLTCR